MLHARQRFTLLWKRLVAALSLVVAAALAPAAVPAQVAGAGAVGSRAGHGAAVANAASGLLAHVAAQVEAGEQRLPLGAAGDDTPAKSSTPAAGYGLGLRRPAAVSPWRLTTPAPAAHAVRSGLTRAPPAA